MKRILVVDDEPQIRRMLRISLQSSGYSVTVAADGEEGYRQFETERPDVVITDLRMPGMDGLELTQSIRRLATTPIIVLSVRAGDPMKVTALDAGADDYLTKPFSMPELLARVRVQLRRGDDEAGGDAKIETGDFVIDVGAHTVAVRGVEVRLTPKEFDLLVALARAPGRVLTHRSLLRTVWGASAETQPEYLRVLIAGLRKKVSPSDGARYIQSEPWVGYRLTSGGDPES